jgi:ligand-binding SRPBCC domain-containing protein
MHIFEFNHKTRIQHPIDTVFAFFSSAENLGRITPPLLKFTILTPTPIEMKQGALIDYKLRIRGIPIRWRTLISTWEPPFHFVDEQLKGPYRMWHHTHSFESVEGDTATIMHDNVKYSILGGRLAHFMIKKDIDAIFAFRTQAILEFFPENTINNTNQTIENQKP